MADDVTFQSEAPATPPAGFVAETYDTGSGHRQIVAIAASGSKTVSAASCDTSADQLVAANIARRSVTIQNVGSVDIYLGPSGVTTSSGLLLAAGTVMTDDKSRDAWYGVTASGTGNVRCCEVAG